MIFEVFTNDKSWIIQVRIMHVRKTMEKETCERKVSSRDSQVGFKKNEKTKKPSYPKLNQLNPIQPNPNQ